MDSSRLAMSLKVDQGLMIAHVVHKDLGCTAKDKPVAKTRENKNRKRLIKRLIKGCTESLLI